VDADALVTHRAASPVPDYNLDHLFCPHSEAPTFEEEHKLDQLELVRLIHEEEEQDEEYGLHAVHGEDTHQLEHPKSGILDLAPDGLVMRVQRVKEPGAHPRERTQAGSATRLVAINHGLGLICSTDHT